MRRRQPAQELAVARRARPAGRRCTSPSMRPGRGRSGCHSSGSTDSNRSSDSGCQDQRRLLDDARPSVASSGGNAARTVSRRRAFTRRDASSSGRAATVSRRVPRVTGRTPWSDGLLGGDAGWRPRRVGAVVGRLGITDVSPPSTPGSSRPARSSANRSRCRRRCSARATTPSAPPSSLRDPAAGSSRAVRMTTGPTGHRPVARRRSSPTAPGLWTFAIEAWSDPLGDLAPRRHGQDRGRPGRRATSPTTSRPAPGCSSGWPTGLPRSDRAQAQSRRPPRCATPRSTWPTASRPRSTPDRPAPRRTQPGARAGHRLAALPALGRPAARAVRVLVRVLPPLDRRRARRRPAGAGATGAARHLPRRRRAPRLRRRPGLRRRLPAADPPDRRGQPQGPEQHPGRRAVGRRLAVGDRLARTAGTTRSTPSSARWTTSRRSSRRASELGMEVALDFALQAAPDHPWVTEHPEWFTTKPDGTIAYAENPPKKYQDIYPINFDNDPDGPLRRVPARRRALDRRRRQDLPGRQPAHQAAELLAVADRRGQGDPPRRAVPRRGLHPAGDDARAGQDRLPPVLHVLHLAQRRKRGARGVRAASWSRAAALHAAELLREHPGHPARRSCSTAGPAALRASGPCWPRRCRPTWGVYSGYELYEHLPPSRAARSTSTREKYQLRPRDFAGAEADGRSLAPLPRARSTAIRREHPALQQLRNLHFHDGRQRRRHCVYSKRDAGTRATPCSSWSPSTRTNVREATVTLDLPALGLDWHDRLRGASTLLTGDQLPLGPVTTTSGSTRTGSPAHVFERRSALTPCTPETQ